jgi:class 3 adenylate cyclase
VTLGGPSNAGDASPSLTRGFLFADLRGFTRYVDAHGDHAAAQLLDRYRTLVRGAVASFRGAEIKTEGDSFYVVFDSASAAVRCGLAIVQAAAASAEGTADAIQVGVGVHAGETVETAEGYVGSAVNIAARLCAQAKAGELVVSETVRSLTRTYLDVEFEPLGTRRLKGLDEPIRIDRVVPRGSTSLRARHPQRRGVGRLWVAGVAAVALVVVVAVAGAMVLQGARTVPTVPPSLAVVAPSPGSTPSPAAPTASAAPSDLTLAEQSLKARIPSEFRADCARSNREKGAAGGNVSLQCELKGTPAYGADTVWYDAFDESSHSQMEVFVNGVVDRGGLPPVGGGSDAVLAACAAGAGKAEGRWSLGSTFSGRLACYSKGGEARILWTYEGSWILAQAVRIDGDAKSLQAWWKGFAYYLQ